jgi:hypothetical protein
MAKTHIASEETHQRIANALEIMAGKAVLHYDSEAGEYTPESIRALLAAGNNGLAYGVTIPEGSATACAKVGANAGIAAPTPGYTGVPAVDPYAGVGPFRYLLVNATVDADGYPHVTAIEGDTMFARDGSNGSVWVLTPVLYWRLTLGQLFVSDTRLSGMQECPNAKLPDGTLRPFMLTARYWLGKDANNAAASISGVKPWTYNVSHDSLITQCATATTGYSGKAVFDDWYPKVMMLLKYATKNSQSVFAGCTSYDVTAQVTVAETDATRIIVSTTDAAKLVVGSAVMVGTANTDRVNATAHDIVDSARVLGIAEYDASNSAVTLDITTAVTTETTHYLKSAPWWSGSCDGVEGDGTPTLAGRTSGKEPFVLQGVELMGGFYEVLGPVILNYDGTNGPEICINWDSRNEATSVTSAYTHTGKYLYADTTDGWKYALYPDSADGLLFGAGNGGSQSTGTCDGHYMLKASTTGTREWRGLGALGGGGNAGLWCVYAGDGLGIAGWGFGSRLSGVGRASA